MTKYERHNVEAYI